MTPDRVAVPGSERSAPLNAAVVGDVDPTEAASVTVIVRPRTPLPPAGGERISREEFAQRHGATPDDLAAVARFAAENGLNVVASDAARRSVQLSGTVEALSRAFGASLRRYERD